jgi:hypothetical protein
VTSRVRAGAVSIVRAATVGAAVSGLPSTAHAVLTGRDPLASTRAAGTLLQPRRERGSLLAGAVAHGVISLGWTAVLAVLAPPGARARWGAAAAVAVAAVDLKLIGRRFPAIRAMPFGPQVVDHVVFGAVVGWVLDRNRLD